MVTEFVDNVCQECGRDLSAAAGLFGDDARRLHARIHALEAAEEAILAHGVSVNKSAATLRALAHSALALEVEHTFAVMMAKLAGEESN